MTRNVVVFEDGLMDRSRDAYAGDHLARDMAFSRNVTRRLENRRQGGSGDERWVTSSYRKIGTFRREKVKQTTRETILLRRERAGWRIAHIHWSSVADAAR